MKEKPHRCPFSFPAILGALSRKGKRRHGMCLFPRGKGPPKLLNPPPPSTRTGNTLIRRPKKSSGVLVVCRQSFENLNMPSCANGHKPQQPPISYKAEWFQSACWEHLSASPPDVATISPKLRSSIPISIYYRRHIVRAHANLFWGGCVKHQHTADQEPTTPTPTHPRRPAAKIDVGPNSPPAQSWERTHSHANRKGMSEPTPAATTNSCTYNAE